MALTCLYRCTLTALIALGSLCGCEAPRSAGETHAAQADVAPLTVAPITRDAVADLGEAHNEALADYFSKHPEPIGAVVTFGKYQEVADAVTAFAIEKRNFDPAEAADSAQQATQLFMNAGAFVATPEGLVLRDPQTLLQMVVGHVVAEGAIDPLIGDAILQADAVGRLQSPEAGLAMIDASLNPDDWAAPADAHVAAFVDVAHHSYDYWSQPGPPGGDGTSRLSWGTLIGDAIGAIGGALAGGPGGAIIGASVISLCLSGHDDEE